jgi:hypothetical protein
VKTSPTIAAGLAFALAGYLAWRESGAADEDSIQEAALAHEEALAAELAEITPHAPQQQARPATGGAGPVERAAVAADPAGERRFGEVVVYGSVLGAGGEAVKPWVALEDQRGETRSASSASPGSWSIAGLRPGRWRLSGRVRGFVTLREELDVPGHAESLRHDLVLERGLRSPVKLLDQAGELVPFGSGPASAGTWVVATRAIGPGG